MVKMYRMVLRVVLSLATTCAIASAMTSCSGTTMAARISVFQNVGQNFQLPAMVWKCRMVKPPSVVKASQAICRNGHRKKTTRKIVAGASSR